MLDDLTRLVTEIGDKLAVVMVPKVEGAWDIHYVDRLPAQLEAKAGVERPILLHALLEKRRPDGEVAAATGVAVDEVMWRRAELVNSVAADAGEEGAEGALAVSAVLGRLPPQAWEATTAASLTFECL